MSEHTGRVDTWFGDPDDPQDRTRFRVQRDTRRSGGELPDWEADERLTVQHITGSNRNDLFIDGFGPETLTLRLRFDTREAYHAFRARRHTTGTLQLLAGFSSLGGEIVHEGGRDYVRFADVFLQAPARVDHHIGGYVECEATFLATEPQTPTVPAVASPTPWVTPVLEPILVAPLDGSLAYEDGGAGGTATAPGALRYVQGYVPGPEAGGTNHATEPTIAAGATSTNWWRSDTTTWSYTDDAAIVGVRGGRITLAPGESCYYLGLNTHQAGDTWWSLTTHVRAQSGAADLRVRYMHFGDLLRADDTVSLAAGEEARVGNSVDASAYGDGNLLLVLINDGAASVTLDVDGWQFEQTSSPTTYIDGSLGTGYAWTGTPHNSASIRYSWANGGTQAALLEVGGTNLFPNPVAANNTTSWVIFNSSTGRTTSLPSSPVAGVASGIHITDTNADANFRYITPVSGATAGVTVTHAVYLHWPAAMVGKQFTYQFRESGGSTGLEAGPLQTMTPVEGWQRVKHTSTITRNDRTSVYLQMAVDSADRAIGDEYFVTAAQLEEAAAATSYIDGSLGTGYAWTGTAHASASTRAAASLELPLASFPSSLALRYSEDDGDTWQHAYLTSPGSFGTTGSVSHSGGTLTIAPSAERFRLGGVRADGEELDILEKNQLEAASVWAWDTVEPSI